MTTRKPENDLYVVISPTAVKAVSQNLTEYDERYIDPMEGFTSFWDWFNTVWDTDHPDGTVHIVKIS
jgi:hypothetical protein